VSDTHEDLHARTVLIGLAEPLERLAGWLDREYSLSIGRRPESALLLSSQSAKSAESWSRWCRERAREARMWGKAEEGK